MLDVSRLVIISLLQNVFIYFFHKHKEVTMGIQNCMNDV